MIGARIEELPKGYALCPSCRERAYRESTGVGVCSRCRKSISPHVAPQEPQCSPQCAPPFRIACVVPFDKRLSKNAQKTPFKGRMVLTKDARSATSALVQSLVRCITGRPKEVKTLVTIRVFKPNHRMDAVNFVDVVCDCVQKAIGINDHWYSASVDWEIDKVNPRIEIEVGQ